MTVMSRLIRLSYYDRVRQAVPESFRPLLPPPPTAEELPPAAAAAEGDAGAFIGSTPEEVQTAAASQLLAKVPPWHSLALPCRCAVMHGLLSQCYCDGAVLHQTAAPCAAAAWCCATRELLSEQGRRRAAGRDSRRRCRDYPLQEYPMRLIW